jgi:hypothetical protein
MINLLITEELVAGVAGAGASVVNDGVCKLDASKPKFPLNNAEA